MTKIQVTQDDINSAEPGNVYQCPVAKAIKRSLPHWDFVRVGIYAVSFYLHRDDFPGGHPIHFTSLPLEVTRFIRCFDSGDKVEPFEFEIEDE